MVSLQEKTETQRRDRENTVCPKRQRWGGVYRPGTPRIAGNHQRLGRSKEEPSPGAVRESVALRDLNFRLLASTTMQINFCQFKSPGLWQFVAEALGD